MEKKQTALAYYVIEHRRLLIKLEGKEITLGEYAVSSFDLFTKALQMEREQIEESWSAGSYDGGVLGASEYYTQTFKP